MIGGIFMEIYSRNKQVKRILAGILTVIMVLVSIDLGQFISVKAATEYDTLYLIDNTAEKWVKNNNAKIKAIDNSNGHIAYWMTQKDETTWSVKIPKNAYNITFNRYAEDKTTQWNSWSAGGRDKNNAYYVDGTEYGHWSIMEESEEYFHAGDMVYLDVSEFTQWENDDAVMYINFTNASKEENNGNDVLISSADKKMYNPKKVENKIEKDIYQYIVTQKEEGATKLRFWRGNDTTLWNCSVVFSYDDYLKGLNCVKITDWNNGEVTCYEEKPEISMDTSAFKYNETLQAWMCEKKLETLEGTISSTTDIKELSYTVTDLQENILLSGTMDVAKKWKIKKFGLVYGYNTIEVKATAKSGKKYTQTLSIWNTSSENLNNTNIDTTDSDGDGLDNYLESLYGTDTKKTDTDGDGLSDFYEVYLFNTNPLLKDSDKNGVIDSLEDADGDGLSNADEMKKGTNPLKDDTDGDGLTDAEEINQYKTDPLKEDTDEDTLLDGSEIKLGFDPNKKDTDENGVLDCDELVQQKYTYDTDKEDEVINSINVSMECSGDLSRQVQVEAISGEAVTGSVGSAFDISVDADFDTAKVTFSYDETLLGDTKEENLCVLWYNEENEIYEILDDTTVVDTKKNTVTYTTTHFSEYLLVDRQIWYDTWRENPNYRSSEDMVYYNVALTVDVSGSMSGSNIEMAKQTLHAFVNALTSEDYACLVTYNDYAETKEDFIKGNNTDALHSAIDSLSAYGGTSISDGVLEACNQLQSYKGIPHDESYEKIIVLICDGESTCSEVALNAAIYNNIKINCINVSRGSAEELRRIADATGGEYYYAATAADLTEVMKQVQQDTLGEIDTTDTDGDGLYDVYEVNGMRIATGEIIYTNPNEADTDGDGITDGEEMGEMATIDYEMDGTTFSCTLFHNSSDPNKEGNTLPTGWKYVDSMDYLPISPGIYNKMYVENPDENIYKEYINVKTIHGYESLHGVMAEKITEEKAKELNKNYYIRKGEAIITALTFAGQFLNYYLGNEGGVHHFDASSIIYQGDMGIKYLNNIKRIYKNRKKLVKEGETVYLACETDLSGNSLTGCRSYTNDIVGMGFNINQFLAINAANAAMVVELSFDGETYTATYHYYVIDYYNWDGNPKDLDELNLYGLSSNYVNYGKYTASFKWNKEDDMHTAIALEQEKVFWYIKFPPFL